LAGRAVIGPGADGFHHPATEEQIAELVAHARQTGRQVRVRGAGHSSAGVAEPDPDATDPIFIMLDGFRGWRIRDAGRRIVEADAGLNLGADPSDPTGNATLESSLLFGLADQQGWTLHDTGGITHQTVNGFTATGSAGGSVQASCADNLYGFRIVDGTGTVREYTREDADPSRFFALAPNLGLHGVVSAVMLEAMAPQPGFRPTRYQRFGTDPETTMYLISFLYTVLGNLDDVEGARAKLQDDLDRLDGVLARLVAAQGLGEAGQLITNVLQALLRGGVDAALTVLGAFRGPIADAIPELFPELIGLFVPFDDAKPGVSRGEPMAFRDSSWAGLPMDNAVDDAILPTRFTEVWVPLDRARDAMVLVRDFFAASADDHEAYARTGLNAWELYASKPNGFWLSPGYSDGADAWAGGALRIDPYWFMENAADPSTTLFAGLWELIAGSDIPFRLHWGKHQPPVVAVDRTWVDRLREQYPRWDDWLTLRAEHDPDGVFLTRYWRDRLGLRA
jgi:FAD binding domain/D-arabinono-1,4-lactone oxidase